MVSRALALAALLLAAWPSRGRAQGPQVGDTIWVTRSAHVPARFVPRAPEWQPQGDVELLGPPRLVTRGDSALVSYPLVVWLPGTRTIDVPGPVLVGPDGAADSVAPAPITLSVASVLPDRPVSQLQPQPPTGIVPRTETTPVPLLLLLALGAVSLGPLHLLWRRRGRPTADAVSTAGGTPALERWAAAGEGRAVAASAAFTLRGAIARRVPEAHAGLETPACIDALSSAPALAADLSVPEIATVLRALDDARFRPEPRDDALALARRALGLAARLDAPAAAPAAAPEAAA